VKGRKDQFIKEMGKELNLEIVAVDNPKDALLESDIMVTATSYVDKPYIKKEWIREGDLGIFVHHRVWENAAFFFSADKIVVDGWVQTKSYGMEDDGFYGDLPECYAELGEILAGLKLGRGKKDEKITAITCGLGILDIGMGKLIYYSGHKESNNLQRDIVILRVLRGAELISQSAFERNIQPAWQSLKLLTRRYLNSGQGNMSLLPMIWQLSDRFPMRLL